MHRVLGSTIIGEDDGHFDYDDERIREGEAATVAADLWRASAHERMARSRAKKKEAKRAAERIREREGGGDDNDDGDGDDATIKLR